MLDLLRAPMLDRFNRRPGRVVKHAPQIVDVVGCVVFDKRSRFHRCEQLAVDLVSLEAGPVDVVERPPSAVYSRIGHPRSRIGRCFKNRGKPSSKPVASPTQEARPYRPRTAAKTRLAIVS